MGPDHQNVDYDRPVVLDTGSSGAPRGWRPRTVFAVAVAGILAAGGLAAGSWSIWSSVSRTEPTENQAPLWFSPPAPVPPAEPAVTTGSTVTSPTGPQ
ncbi:hypothetical protein [Actinophytocola sp.]|uniref:hypothetical protein n=1 Tax=Actinophytocola sp. TaxID=1872138 RepID=UPI002D7ED647|nr:hypothetical protein [Actinophytocola sp.]HET9142477.1 hypothetical protein [Actinophytocola sp.]